MLTGARAGRQDSSRQHNWRDMQGNGCTQGDGRRTRAAALALPLKRALVGVEPERPLLDLLGADLEHRDALGELGRDDKLACRGVGRGTAGARGPCGGRRAALVRGRLELGVEPDVRGGRGEDGVPLGRRRAALGAFLDDRGHGRRISVQIRRSERLASGRCRPGRLERMSWWAGRGCRSRVVELELPQGLARRAACVDDDPVARRGGAVLRCSHRGERRGARGRSEQVAGR